MSTILSEKKTLSPWAKGGIGLGAGALLLVLVGLLFPTAAAFFPLVSLWCSWCADSTAHWWVLHTAGVELDFFHRAPSSPSGPELCSTSIGRWGGGSSSTPGIM